ncbi:lebercilin-like protein [Stegastes partitus]|uniref:Lebercilin-like protein n=1 Tax=Stegastes partitus TaxID=144197 RepID=A0A9Y4MTH6_9TELE|nr:PREDICTED: lebercilin-like protein [Stegastes partitus]
MDKEARCEKQQAPGHIEGDDDAVSCSTDTSRWSSPSRLSCGSESPQHSSDCEDKAGSLIDKTPDVMPSVKRQGLKQSAGKAKEKDKKAQAVHKQIYTANHQILKLPPIKPLQVSMPRLQSVNLNSIRELMNQVWDLQQQLKDTRTENRLLKRSQHRHSVALQYYQDSEDSISQISKKYSNEVRALQTLLNETRTSRDNLARKLQSTEGELLKTKAALQHLQLLSQDHSLLQRKDLTLRLAEATAELERKDKRILDMQKNLDLCKASFKHQTDTQQKKIKEERKLTCYLQEQIYQLTQRIQDRERELQKHNIYSQRHLKGSSKKGRENKMVQTDGFVFLPTEVAKLLEFAYSETKERLEQQESFRNLVQNENTVRQGSLQQVDDGAIRPNARLRGGEDGWREEGPRDEGGKEEEGVTREEELEVLEVVRTVLRLEGEGEATSYREQVTEHKCRSPAPAAAQPGPQLLQRKDLTLRLAEATAELEMKDKRILEGSIAEIGRSITEIQPRVIKGSPHPFSRHYAHDASTDSGLLPKVRHKYIFTKSTEDLHNGRPVSSMDTTSCESTKSTVKVESSAVEFMTFIH